MEIVGFKVLINRCVHLFFGKVTRIRYELCRPMLTIKE